MNQCPLISIGKEKVRKKTLLISEQFVEDILKYFDIQKELLA